MRVHSWCFCNGGGKSERLKATIFSTRSAAMAKLSASASSASTSSPAEASGTGFLIHRNLLLTTHINIPSVNAAESAEILLQNGVPASLVPHRMLAEGVQICTTSPLNCTEVVCDGPSIEKHCLPPALQPRFFITNSVLDLTIVGLDTIEGDSVSPGHQPQFLKLCSKPNLELGNIVYLLGHAEKKELSVGEGKVVIATDNLIKLSTEGFTWSPGSVGFDSQGNLAFMICDPMKLATSPNTTSASSSPASWKKDLPMQFGIPLHVIFDWLNQHWEESVDDLSKPKLPLMRLLSAGHRSEHSCASFSMRQVFKATEETEGSTSSPNAMSKPKEQPGQGSSTTAQMSEDEKVISQPHHAQGIPTPEIYESPKVTANPVQKKETAQIPLLDINFPPRVSKPSPAPQTQASKDVLPGSGENCMNESRSRSSLKEEKPRPIPLSEDKRIENREVSVNGGNEEAASTGSVGDRHSEVSSSSPVAVSEVRDDHSSERETLYSAETAESRNYTSPREGRLQPVGRSQSCVSYNRWGPVQRNPAARQSPMEKRRSFMQPRKTYSQGAPSHKTMDYFSPTVSSIMKKRNNMDQLSRPRPTAAVNSSPRWNF